MTWIKMVHDIAEKPETIAIAQTLSMDRFAVTGRLHKIWSWFDLQTIDGHAPGVSAEFLDLMVAREGFADAMVLVGWLHARNDRLSMPNFDRHNSKSAKVRALAASRQSRRRHGTRVTKSLQIGDASSLLLSISDSSFLLPKELDNESFRACFVKWLEYKSERHEPYKPAGLKGVIARADKIAAKCGLQKVIEAIETAIANGWKGWDHANSFTGNQYGKPQQHRSGRFAGTE